MLLIRDDFKPEVMGFRNALSIAQSEGLDLLLINKDSNPVVVKMLDYGKFKYDRDKKNKESRKNQVITKVKTVKLTPFTQENDLQTHRNKMVKWIEEGCHIRVEVRLRGRMNERPTASIQIIEKLINPFIDSGKCKLTQDIKKDGNIVSCQIAKYK